MSATLLSLFSGGGLADVGARQAGFEPVGAVEWDPAIADAYAANVGPHVTVSPVEQVDYRPFAGVGAVWASPCCTNASVANQQGGESEQDRSAGEAVCRCLREARPRVFVLENVWGYRKFDAFAGILNTLQTLGYGWRYEHINAADFGVPQTRKRLILRASLAGQPEPLVRTHCDGGAAGGLFGTDHDLHTWIGWYAAVEDLLPTLPESQFAKWQLARLSRDLVTALVQCKNSGQEWGNGTRAKDVPSFAVVTDHKPSHAPKASLVNSKDSGPHARPLPRRDDAPSMTVVAADVMPRALLVHGTSDMGLRHGGAPSATVPATLHAKGSMPKALLVDDQYGSNNRARERGVCARAPGEPAFVAMATEKTRMRALLVDNGNPNRNGPVTHEAETPCVTVIANQDRVPLRAWLEQGRVVAMTPRALARFQSVPDDYRLPEKTALACRVIGNAVPPTLAQVVLQSLGGAS